MEDKVKQFFIILIDKWLFIFVALPILILVLLLGFSELEEPVSYFLNILGIFGYIISIAVLETTKSIKSDIISKVEERYEREMYLDDLEEIIKTCTNLDSFLSDSSKAKLLHTRGWHLVQFKHSFDSSEEYKGLKESIIRYENYLGIVNFEKIYTHRVQSTYRKFLREISGLAIKIKREKEIDEHTTHLK